MRVDRITHYRKGSSVYFPETARIVWFNKFENDAQICKDYPEDCLPKGYRALIDKCPPDEIQKDYKIWHFPPHA